MMVDPQFQVTAVISGLEIEDVDQGWGYVTPLHLTVVGDSADPRLIHLIQWATAEGRAL